MTAEPLGEPIAHYFDHFQVPELLADETLVVREDLRRLGLTNLPFE